MSVMIKMEYNDVFAVLTKAYRVGAYHWIIYVVQDESKGWRFNATDNGGRIPWTYELIEWQGPADYESVAFFKIGRIDDGLSYEHLAEYVKDIPMSVPENQKAREPFFTCRVWFKEAIRQLHAAGVFVRCDDVDALEAELVMKATATEYREDGQVLFSSAINAGSW